MCPLCLGNVYQVSFVVMGTQVRPSAKLRLDTTNRIRDQLAVRNGPRHSVYWVQRKKSDGLITDSVKGTTMAALTEKVEYSMGGKYTGDWKDGEKHGYGSFVDSRGHKYEGEWVKDQREGYGVFWVNDKKRLRKEYAGEWRLNQREGRGTFFYKDGGKYDGEWRRNKRHGQGRMVYQDDGSVYDGEWDSNARSGRGTHVLANGDRYDGFWVNDKKEGPGRYFYKGTRKVYEGEWVDGAPKCGTFADALTDQDDRRDGNPLDDNSPLNACKLPELELAFPDKVLNEMITRIRQDRVCKHVDAVPVDNVVHAVAQEEELGVVVFDAQMLRLIQSTFAALLDEQSSAWTETLDAKPGRNDTSCIPCSSLPRLIADVHLRVSDEQLQELLLEIGATGDTLVSLAECVDVLSLLRENCNDMSEEARQ